MSDGNYIPHITTVVPEEIAKEVLQFTGQKSPILIGSRYMSQFWPWSQTVDLSQSDWDFVFPYGGSELEESLRAKRFGWTEKVRLKYMDLLSFAVYEKSVTVQGVQHRVQALSKINLRLFMKTWGRIDPAFYWRFLHKSSPEALPRDLQTEVFNQLYKAVGF